MTDTVPSPEAPSPGAERRGDRARSIGWASGAGARPSRRAAVGRGGDAAGDEAPLPSSGLEHPCLGAGVPEEGVPVASFAGSDQQRIGLLLQACGLLSHLRRAGLRPGCDLTRATVDPALRLRLGADAAGRFAGTPQRGLRQLTRTLFAAGGLAGRGQGRRAARALVAHWNQDLVPVSPDVEVGRILDEAPFLWEPSHAVHRRALAGRHRDGSWIAGPGAFRRRLLAAVAAGGGSVGPEELVAGPRGVELWLASPREDPRALVRERRWAEAVRAWSLAPPSADADRLSLARCLLSLGRFQSALSSLKGLTTPGARVLRLQCQVQLGRLRAARRSLGQLARLELTPAELVEVAEVALRVCANQGDAEGTREWIARARTLRRGRAAIDGRVVAAVGHWDLGDTAAMERELQAAGEAAAGAELSWIHHQARGLLAELRGDGAAAVACLEAALRVDRRALRRYQAGRLWTDLVLARTRADDLSGAERACRHAVRLLAGCDGPARTTLALYNLAEVRIRRGRLAGVEAIILGSQAENRASGNVRGLACDAELRARFELARGDAEAALSRCRELLEADQEVHNRPELELLAARALGWLRRPRAASHHLVAMPQRTLTLLEPEERPAVFALADEGERAFELADENGGGAVWRAALAGRPVAESAWSGLETIGRYRQARLAFDLELLRPGAISRSRRVRAARVLREAGAVSLAERLEAQEGAAWSALDAYLAEPTLEPARLRSLLTAVGLLDPRLERCAARSGDWEVLVPGRGGPVGEEHRDRGASWRLVHGRPDPAAGAVLRAIALADRERERRLSRPAGRRAVDDDGMIGSSPALREAVERLRRLGARDVPVLIQGETGTGKELAARLLHKSSPRADGPFLAINCAALSETLGLSDLFGHARGAFTGADRDRSGVFESARGGTVLLDEIGDLPLPAQGLLLRVLQEGEVRRLGESLPRAVDVRVVAATHRDLAERVTEGAFREDLLYRLCVGRVMLPALRERGDDLDELVAHFLASWPGLEIDSAALRRLKTQSWPGNVRQLKAAVDSAAALLDPLGEPVIRERQLDLPAVDVGLPPYHQWLEQIKRRRISEVLAACGGNQSEAARRLGLTRQALSYLVRQLGPFD
ncbi:MAG TPA: sigma 54-interacting transcriptional regulator [Thermoanaerobaculia bacterium]|nr:sigma 54-interacting transcriptional regulator [Thermoanaerobaculia bacterium]